MKWIIANPKTNKLLTINTFNSVDECLKEVTSKTKYWQKLVKKKQLPTDRLKAWKNSVFLCLNWEQEVYGDLNMSYNQQTTKPKNNSKLSAFLETHKQQKITKSVDNYISNKNRQTYAG